MGKIAALLEHRAVFSDLRKYSLSVVKAVSSKMDIWIEKPTDSHTQILLKEAFVEFLCRMQDVQCLKKASELFYKIPNGYFNNPSDPRYNNT